MVGDLPGRGEAEQFARLVSRLEKFVHAVEACSPESVNETALWVLGTYTAEARSASDALSRSLCVRDSFVTLGMRMADEAAGRTPGQATGVVIALPVADSIRAAKTMMLKVAGRAMHLGGVVKSAVGAVVRRHIVLAVIAAAVIGVLGGVAIVVMAPSLVPRHAAPTHASPLPGDRARYRA